MGAKKHVMLALDSAAWGRTILGIDIANQLRRSGDACAFIAHTASAQLVRASDFRLEELPRHVGALSQLYIEEFVRAERPDCLVLCDFHSCFNYFRRRGVDPEFLWTLDTPLIALDIWNSAETTCDIDFFGDRTIPRAHLTSEIAGRLVPSPFARPTADAAYCAFRSECSVSASQRRDIRRFYGVTDADQLVLFCTASWQHQISNPNGVRLLRNLPDLLWSYLRQVGTQVRLVHVGPMPLRFAQSDERYRWQPPMDGNSFCSLLGSANLLLSANLSATSHSAALALGIPVVVACNTVTAARLEDVEERFGGVSDSLRLWLKHALPIYPFSLWPLGYSRYLEPLFRDNPLCSVLDILEVLDEQTFVDRCRALMLDRAVRERVHQQIALYAEQVGQLPQASVLISQYLN